MTVITPAQAYTLARNAGFAPALAAIMAAIAGPESGYRTDAVGDTTITTSTWGPSIGIWQIRSIRADTGTGKPRDATRLKDPVFNASAAYSIWKSQGLNAWTGYSSGAYRSFLGKANSAAASGGADLPATQTGSTSTPVQQIDWLPGGSWNPLNHIGNPLGVVGTAIGAAAGTALGAIWEDAKPMAVYLLALAAGMALITIGATVTVWPVANGPAALRNAMSGDS